MNSIKFEAVNRHPHRKIKGTEFWNNNTCYYKNKQFIQDYHRIQWYLSHNYPPFWNISKIFSISNTVTPCK